jgi:peptidoglycan/LPS O-acetylase OafA/YrhL
MLFFLQEWRKQKRTENEQYIPLALTLLYLFLTISFIMNINSNYFIDPALLQMYIESKVYFFFVGIACALITGVLIYTAERIVRRNTKHIFLIYFACVVILFFIFKSYDLPSLGYFIIFLIPLVGLIALLGYKIVWKSSGKIRQKMLIVLVGYAIFIIAIVSVIQMILLNQYEFTLELRGLILVASLLAGYGFYSIPSFTEFDWEKKVRHLFLLNSEGLCIYQFAFKKGTISDEDLFSGSLMAIQSLMQEMVKSEKTIKVIDQEDVKILFERSSNALGVILAEEDLYIVHFKLRQLLSEFELLFGPTMQNWKGDLDHFHPLDSIIKRIFEIKS